MMKGTTIHDLLLPHKVKTPTGNVHKASPSVVDGLTPAKYPMTEGYHIATPEQLASLLVPRQEVDAQGVRGFQRELKIGRVRQIDKAVADGTLMPTIEVALHNNAAWVTDGQHRAAAGVVGRHALPTLARHMTEEQMRRLFASQASALKVNPSTLVLSANDPFSEYVQDAVTDPTHPWAELVTYHLSSDKKLTPSQARQALISYVGNTLNPGHGISGAHAAEAKEFDPKIAADLGELLLALGGKEKNPAAFRSAALRATIAAAVIVIRRHHRDSAAAINRWKKHMPKFAYHRYLAVTSTQDMVPLLINHWNKRLDETRRVTLEG